MDTEFDTFFKQYLCNLITFFFNSDLTFADMRNKIISWTVK
jgi:hypothetical protein